MANMRQKAVQVRGDRRKRYIKAIEPFRQKYNCTAAQVFGIIDGIEKRHNGLMKEKAELEEKVDALKEMVTRYEAAEKELKIKLADSEKSVKELVDLLLIKETELKNATNLLVEHVDEICNQIS